MGNYSCMHCLAETDNDDEWCDDCRAERNTPDPAPSVQPVRAWAVKHNTKGVIATRTDWTKSHAEQIAGDWDVPASPHRVIRVEIREVADE